MALEIQSPQQEPSQCELGLTEAEVHERALLPTWWSAFPARREEYCGYASREMISELARRRVSETQRSPRPQNAIDVLNLQLQLNALRKQHQKLSRRVNELEKLIDQRSPASTFTQVSSLGMPGYTVQKPIPVTICQDGEEFTATFFDANISTGGDTGQEAVANLQNLIADFYDELVATPDGQLGPSLQRQKLILLEFVCRT